RPSVSLSRSQAGDLAALIARMQKNADQVEKNILRSEEKQTLIHRKECAEKLAEAELLLKDLYMDVDKAKKLKHPQATEIERDVRNLHDRWVKDCAFYRDLYDKVQGVEPTLKIDWGPLLDEKLKQINTEAYGPNLTDVEKQTAAHNILHQEIESYSAQLQPSTTTSKYAKLLSRRSHLASLYEYMQSCSKEMVYLSGQQERILQRDWSDRMADPPSVRMEYEKFKDNGLLAHETEINKLQEVGDRLVEMKHPGSQTIQAHRDTVQEEWQAFLNLCLAQEVHLDNIEDYRKFQLDAETLSESLERLSSTVDPKALAKKSNPEVLLALERSERSLADLRELSSSVVPLKLRRLQPTKLTTVVSVCDWTEEEVGGAQRGDTLILKSNSDNNNWKLQTSSGKITTFPGACFMIPPPDAEALEKVNRYTVQTCCLAPEDPRAAELAGELDKINRGLDRVEKEIQGRLRTPLDKRNPTQDLDKRLQEHERSAQTVRTLESEKAAVQREMEPILANKPLGPSTSTLPIKLGAANKKLDDIDAIMELYKKKATASLYLENQIQNVEGIVSGFEEQLVKDGKILDQPNALQSRNQQLQAMHKAADSKKDVFNRLGKDLDLTKQACSSLQQRFSEYCPDIRRQENAVKNLKNRYANVNSQLQERSALIQNATNKNQDFQNAVQSADFFLVNLPNNAIKPTDDATQITAKQDSQKVGGRVRLLQLLQATALYCFSNILNFSSSILLLFLLQEKDLLNLFSEVSAKNSQLLSQLGTAKNIRARQLQLQSQQKDLEESDFLKKELNEEIARRLHAENNLETYRQRLISLKNRRGVERLEEKEVVQYYRDPKLEVEVQSMKNRIQEEALKRSKTSSEIEMISERIVKLEIQLTKIEPKLVNKVVTEYERDPQLDKEAAKIREEMERIRLELQTKHNETVQVKTELTVLSQQQQKIKEKVVKKEVVRIEKDPEMLKAVITFKTTIAEEESQCKALNDSIFSTRSQINTLERVIPTIQPKIVTKLVKQVQQDPKVLEESRKLQMAVEEEKDENVVLMKDLTTLQLRYAEVEKLRPKVEVKEIINEIYRVDPETEVELTRLKKELQDSSRKRTDLEKEMNTVLATLTTLRAQKPKMEYKEVMQEVVKEEKSPEVVRELQKLTNQVSQRDDLKAEKSKVETKLVNKEVIKYENDPLLEKEADRLRRNVREEIQQRRSLEECLFDLQHQYILLERQKPEEKVVMQEVVRLQKDPTLILEHEKLNKTLDEEMKGRRKLELEVRQLRAMITEKQNILAQMDDRQKKIQVESELRQIKARILELESSPPRFEEKVVVEEVLKVERDPKLEKLMESIQADLNTESTNISRLDREIRNLKLKLEIVQKEKSIEKVVHREVVRVEKDPAVEAEREHLRELLAQERNLRRDLEDNIHNINIKIVHLQTSKTATSQEGRALIMSRDALQREKEDFLRQLKTLESQRQTISVTFQQQSKLMSERNQMARQRSLRTSSEIERLEREILNEKDKIHQREALLIELQNNITKEDHAETHTRETNLSTKITIMDPETGKDLSPYDAYLQGLIDRNHYIRLSELECDWEEITSTGPEGDITILQDRKSGQQYSVRDALKSGPLLVAGETKMPSIPPLPVQVPRSPTRPVPASPMNSTPSTLSAPAGDDTFPISGIFDTTTESRMSVRSALTRKLLEADTAVKLLEAQAASGGIVDLSRKDKLSVHKAADIGLIDSGHKYKLLNAQKAFTGVEDPVTKQRLAVGQAAQKGYIPKENAKWYMEAQYLTGGLVDPSKAGRLTVDEALASNLIDSTTAKDLKDEASHTKDLVDPITKEKISYKQAMDRCRRDISTGLLLLPAASTATARSPSYLDTTRSPSYSNYQFRSPYGF
uniref:Uncharacterized protein n=1 Tax=Monopterus albus TaxID=43700 RepID=A0A3Q3Q455_MONAL